MIGITEAQLLGWLNPLLWPFLRCLALLSAMPLFSQRAVPLQVRIGLAMFFALAAQASLPAMPVLPLDAPPLLLMLVLQQLVIGIAMGFAVRLVFAAMEFAGELIGLQMGLNFAGFFDPATGMQGTATARFLGTLVSFLFVVTGGHLLLVQALAQSFHAFPVGPEPFAFVRAAQPQTWGAEIFRAGFWVALPLLALLLFVNLALGVVSRVAPQLNIFAIGFPLTVSVGLVGLLATLPLMQTPLEAVMTRLLSGFA
ncbi:MAG: flagellar biosynthetic protein FliR [Burkholderiales bacterium]|nr:flagellar biosynthetic protein FliR [Burkholderiales bacterium]